MTAPVDETILRDLARHAGMRCIQALTQALQLAPAGQEGELARRIFMQFGGGVACAIATADGVDDERLRHDTAFRWQAVRRTFAEALAAVDAATPFMDAKAAS